MNTVPHAAASPRTGTRWALCSSCSRFSASVLSWQHPPPPPDPFYFVITSLKNIVSFVNCQCIFLELQNSFVFTPYLLFPFCSQDEYPSPFVLFSGDCGPGVRGVGLAGGLGGQDDIAVSGESQLTPPPAPDSLIAPGQVWEFHVPIASPCLPLLLQFSRRREESTGVRVPFASRLV